MKTEKQKKGFTILETLITLLAISIMIVGPVTFVAKSYHYANFVKQKIIATGLSQEGLELATSLRNLDLAQFKNMASACSTSCAIDWNGNGSTPTYTPCTDTGCQLSLITNDDGSRSYRNIVGGEVSDFSRFIKITTNGSQSYTVEADTYADVDGLKLQVKLKKVMFPIVIK